MKKVTLNTEWLSVCGGCHVAIVDLHEKILKDHKWILSLKNVKIMIEKYIR